jgi:hypothetical protein
MNWINFKNALITALLWAVVGAGGYVLGIGDIFKIDFHTLANVAFIPALAFLISWVKGLLTTSDGHFLGVVKIKKTSY